MELIERHVGTGEVLFGGTDNKEKLDPHLRQVIVEVEKNVEGLYVASLGFGRYVPIVNKTVVDRWDKHSPIFSDVGAAQDWAQVVFDWAVRYWRGQLINPDHRPFPEETDRWHVCPSCDHFNTIKVKLLAYGNESWCTREECNYEDYFSIGD